jgi:transcriptional regulator with XRE-family HTH domain
MLNKREFGDLVKAYRKQRGWTQEELAERWGHSRAYISQIESGKKKLDSVAQVIRLADILDIPQEQLEAIGRGIPQRRIKATSSKEADSAILQMLLAPGRDMVQMSYMLWVAGQYPVLEEKLKELTLSLDQALLSYHGEFLKPAQQLLAYTHQMRGRIAFDSLDFAAASGHFSEMIDLGHELNDSDIIAMGMIYQGSILRKRGRFETALRCFEAAKPFVQVASEATQGIYHINLSTVHADAGQEKPFLEAIDAALEIARDVKDSIAGLANDFSLDDVLWAQAGGFSELWKPEKALEVYQQTDKLRPFRPLRELGAYTIDKGEAYLRMGELDQGVALSLRGIQLASEYRSKRHIGWVEKTCNRLSVLPIGKDKKLLALRDALREVKQKQEDW